MKKNFNRRAIVRLAVAPVALLAAGAMVGLSGPAQARALEPAANLSVAVPGPKIAVGSAGKNIRIDVKNNGDGVAKNSKLTLGTADVTDAVTVTLPDSPELCQATATQVVCTLGAGGELAAGATDTTVAVYVEPKPNAKLGVAGKLTASVSADGTDKDAGDNTTTVDIEIVKSGVDFVSYGADVKLNQGETAPLGFSFVNEGSESSNRFNVSIQLPKYVRYDDTNQDDHCALDTASNIVICAYKGNFVPGSAWSDEIPVSLDAVAPGPASLAGSVKTVEVVEAASAARVAGSTAVMEITAPKKPAEATAGMTSTDSSPGDDTVVFTVLSGENKRDLAVTATATSGKVGDTVVVNVKAGNAGPASGGGIFTIKAPSGTVVLNSNADAGPDCWVGAGDTPQNRGFTEATDVTCTLGAELVPTKDSTFGVKFKIKSSPIGSDGKVVISDDFGTPDPSTANNTASIVITLSGYGGSLPITGVQVGLIGTIGVAVLAAGVVLLILSRRRRVIAVPPGDEASND